MRKKCAFRSLVLQDYRAHFPGFLWFAVLSFFSSQANVDIRSSVDYKGVMREHGLGPNGAIVTSLNLFATQFDQVVGLAERRASEIEFVMVDTPGQIEVRRRV